MCGGGGDGGYSKRQEQMKAAQDAAIKKVNLVFGAGTGAAARANAAERDKLYGTIQTDAESRLMSQLGEDRANAERNLRFQLARQGLAGGSADVDQNAQILEQYNKGALEARNSAIGAANDARSADEQTRVGIINNIRSGMAQNDAISAAQSGMMNNANAARDEALATTIGNFFGDIALANRQQQLVNGYTGARGYGGGNVYGTGGSGGNNGRIINP